MNKKLVALIIISIIVLYYLYLNNKNIIYVKSIPYNKYFYVQNKKDYQDAANLLGKIDNRIEVLKDYLTKNSFPEFENNIRLLNERYDSSILFEATDKKGTTSYSLNKHKIFLCLRQRNIESKDTESFYVYNIFVDINTLMFVILHELTHLSMDDIVTGEQHFKNKKFVNLNNFYLDISNKLNLYTKIDYSQNNKNYCGMVIS